MVHVCDKQWSSTHNNSSFFFFVMSVGHHAITRKIHSPSLLLFRLVSPSALILSHNCNRTQIAQCRGDGTSGLKVTFSYGRPRALCLPELRQFTSTAVTGTLWHYPGAYLFLGEFWRVVIFVIDHDGGCGCACQSDVQSCHILSLNDQFILGIFQGLHSKETPEKTGFRSEALFWRTGKRGPYALVFNWP